MNRHYTKEHYLELIEKLRRVCPDIALSTDIIVGFPGETEEDFQETYDLVSKVGFAQAFTFIYSPREGTPAAKMEIGSSHEEIQDRFDRLVELVQEGAYAYNQGDLGKTISVLVEGPSKRNNQILAGKSVKNQTVHASLPAGVNIDDIAGKTINVKITEAKTWYLSGEAAL
jgi:tRNA-2-methylthio-N6-dimethylallyladenosine synthase